MRTSIDDRYFAGLPVSDVDEHLDASTGVKDLLRLTEIEDALGAGQRGRGSGDGNLATSPPGDFRQGRRDIAGEAPRARWRELRKEHERQ